MEHEKFDMEKLKNLILYICLKAGAGKLNKTKLFKALWFSDSFFYVNTGEPITGESYVRGHFGPIPSNAEDAIRELEEEGKLVETPGEYMNGGYKYLQQHH